MAESQASDFRLQISAAKSAWVGGIGFFWGYHGADPREGPETPECHILWVRSIDSPGLAHNSATIRLGECDPQLAPGRRLD